MRDEKSNVDKPAILKKLTSTSELYKELFRELEIEEKTLSKIHAQALGEAISFGLKAQGGPGAPPTAHAEERQGLGPIYRKLVDISNLIDPSYAATVFAQRTHATFAALHGKKEEEKGWLTAFKATVKERIDDVALRLLTVVSIFLLHVLVIPLALIFGFYKAINSLLGIDLPGFPSLPKKGA